ncbi:MAG: DUF4340 domain-containing protein [Acidobacteriota bacterium]
MNLRTLAVLAALALGLGGFIFFVERDLPSSDERREQATRVLDLAADGLDTEDIVSVELEAAERRIILERVPEPETETTNDGEAEAVADGLDLTLDGAAGGWRVVEPFDAPADGAQVRSLLDRLSELRHDRELGAADPADDAAMGFDAPRAVARLSAADAPPVEIVFGAELALGGGVLVETGGMRYEAFGADLVETIARDPSAWRDPTLLRGVRTRLSSIRLEPADPLAPAVVLERHEERGYRISEPIQDVADPQEVDRLLGALDGLAAQRFLDEAPAEANTGGRLGLVLEGRAEPLDIAFGAPISVGSANRLAEVDGQFVEIDAPAVVEALGLAPAGWRSRALAPVQVFSLDAAIVRTADGELSLTRGERDWTRSLDGGAPEAIDYGVASDLLYAVAEARALEVTPDSARRATLGEPQLEIQLVGDDEPLEIALYSAADGRQPATVSGREVVLELEAETGRQIVTALSALRQAPPLATDAADEAPAVEAP